MQRQPEPEVSKIMEDRWGTKEWFEEMFPLKHADTLGDRWGHRWRGGQKYRFLRSLKVIKPIIVRNEGRLNILDIGCAFGDFTERLYCLNTRGKICATDISENAITIASTRLPQIQFDVEALPDLKFADAVFDIVTCLEVLYYLDKDGRMESLRSINRVMKNGGYLLLSGTINKGQRYFETNELLALIVEEGFQVFETQYLYSQLYSWFETPLQWLDESITSLIDVIEMDEPEYRSWLKVRRNNMSIMFTKTFRKTVRALPWGRKITGFTLRMLNTPGKYAITNVSLVAACDTLTRFLLGGKGATKIIILAQKSNGKSGIALS